MLLKFEKISVVYMILEIIKGFFLGGRQLMENKFLAIIFSLLLGILVMLLAFELSKSNRKSKVIGKSMKVLISRR